MPFKMHLKDLFASVERAIYHADLAWDRDRFSAILLRFNLLSLISPLKAPCLLFTYRNQFYSISSDRTLGCLLFTLVPKVLS